MGTTIDRLKLALAYLERAAEPDQHYGHYAGGDPRLFEPAEDECTPEEIAAHKAACEAWARGERPDIPKACEPNREAITLNDGKTGTTKTIAAGTALTLYAPFGIGVVTWPADEEAVAARDALRAVIADLESRPYWIEALDNHLAAAPKP